MTASSRHADLAQHSAASAEEEGWSSLEVCSFSRQLLKRHLLELHLETSVYVFCSRVHPSAKTTGEQLSQGFQYCVAMQFFASDLAILLPSAFVILNPAICHALQPQQAY